MNDLRSATAVLRRAGTLPDDAIDLAETALALAAFDRPQADIDEYRMHLAALARDAEHAARAAAVPHGDVLREVLVGRYGYTGDRDSYDDLDNANLMRVVDRRRGLPVALSILWLHVARAQGWKADGLNFPSHFLIQVAVGAAPVVIDPFNDGATLSPERLRRLKRRLGGDGELAPEDCVPVGNRAILLRLQNNIKLRLLQAKRRDAALAIVERMVLLAPREPRLWHECATLHRDLGNLKTAIACLEQAMALAADESTRQGVAMELRGLRSQLN